MPRASARCARAIFLALVNGVADGRWEELPDLYAERTDVAHPFRPLRPAALRSRDEQFLVTPAIFVLRVRDGEIVESRDYFDHLASARARGELGALLAAVRTAQGT
ncbi:hypothetical protein [Actinophytocola sp. NPDC049390]|uniref:hypothetical protein n=1 Tax=Actinophytocola sp. NPDC049390 TaxID=3363894 RepID=UPI0037A2A710